MAAIAHASITPVTSAQTRSTGSYADVSGVSLADTAFTTGHKYLILVDGQMSLSAASVNPGVQLVHGSTAFADSEYIYSFSVASRRQCYQYMTVWTAVSGEGIKVQFKGDGTATLSFDQITLNVIDLDDALTENTDWFFAERSNDDSLSATPTDGASITFTPAVAGDWLVMTYAQFDHTGTTTAPISGIVRSGEASSTTPECRIEGSTNRQSVMRMDRVFALTAAENTFKERSASTGTSHTRLHSKIFALNLELFSAHTSSYTYGSGSDLAITSTSNYSQQVATATITPLVQSDVLVGLSFGWDKNQSTRLLNWRLQVDNSDAPGTQTSDAYNFNGGTDSTDEEPCSTTVMMAAMSAAGHTLDIDAHVNSTVSNPAVQNVSLWAFTMELASSEPPTIALDTADDTPFTTPTPELEFTGSDADSDPLTYNLKATDHPTGWVSGTEMSDEENGSNIFFVHTNPKVTESTWEGYIQVDDRPGQIFQGQGGLLDHIDWRFGPFDAGDPALTNGSYLARVYEIDSGWRGDNVSVWQANHAYSQGDKVKNTSTQKPDQQFLYVCTTAGTSAGTEPTWTEVENDTIEDGSTLVWTAHQGAYLLNAAAPEDTPTPGWLAISGVTAYNPGAADLSWKSTTFTGANRIRLIKDHWYAAVLDWRPVNRTTDNVIAVDCDSMSSHPGNFVDDGFNPENNGPRVAEDLKIRIYEDYVLVDVYSDTDDGFVNTEDGGDTDPFTEGQTIAYTFQDALADGTYRWTARANDPGGTASWSDWATERSFTVVSPAQFESDLQASATISGSLTTGIALAAGPTTSGTLVGALLTAIPLGGALDGSATLSGALLTQILAAASPQASATIAGALDTAIWMAAAESASATLVGDLQAGATVDELEAALQADATLAGSLQTAITMAAALQGSATPTAALQTSIEVAAAPQASATLAGALNTQIALAAGLTGSATAAGALLTAIPMVGALSATATPSGALQTSIEAAAALQASATLQGALDTAILMAAALQASGTLAADLQVASNLDGALQASATLGGALDTAIQMASTLTASTSIAGSLDTSIALAALPQGSATIAGALETALRMAAALNASATLQGAIASAAAFEASLQGDATLAGALDTAILLVSQLSGTSTLVGALESPIRFEALVSSSATLAGTLETAIRLGAALSAQATIWASFEALGVVSSWGLLSGPASSPTVASEGDRRSISSPPPHSLE